MRSIAIIAAIFVALHCFIATAQETDDKIDFDRDIRPILSDRCYFCHGPDSAQRHADLRLDMHDDALNVIEPGFPDDSELLRRINSDDPDEQMPPPESKLSVTKTERELIRRWIKQGATWKKHWAFEPRKNPSIPKVKNAELANNEIDKFVVAKLESEKLSLSPRANKEKLIRRVTFDLIGLPPTLQEIDAFLADDSSRAYEKVVDRLLNSKHYGQRMASHWLDVARYSDTYGYQVDRDRFVWPWRDWVIRSYNENKSYDKFVTEQLAGDLLPNATDDQILATTFNRLHPQKVEGGSVEEEFRVEYVADRAQTFATAFLGLTLECARCHDHKFDPISQKEYYQLFSYFNNIDEAGLYSYFTSSVPTPTLQISNAEEKRKLAELKNVVAAMEPPRIAETFDARKWLRNANGKLTVPGPNEMPDFAKIPVGRNARSLDDRKRSAIKLTGDDSINLKSGNFKRSDPFAITLSINTPDTKDRAVIFHRSRAWTDAGSRGYQLLIEEGKLSASLIHFWPGNAIRVKTKRQIAVNQWLDVAFVYDGSSTASGLSLFVNGQREPVEVVRDHLTKNITGGGGDVISIGERFRDRGFTGGQVSNFKVYNRQISDLEVLLEHDENALSDFMEAAASEAGLSNAQVAELNQHVLLNESETYRKYLTTIKTARAAFFKQSDSAKEIMVMRELPKPRPAYVLARGIYSDRLEQVAAKTPSVFLESKPFLQNDRWQLARWLTNSSHPLTARVAVNHYWQLMFGEGLVRTPEDFGRQGALPTHPMLLDWLAEDFVENGWDIKRLLKQMVMSSTYQQSSSASAELLKRDPENQLLARSPSYRMSAEMLRDNVLAASGLLVDKVGGVPVKPYELAASFKPAKPDSGEGLYRRSLYTYWKRTGPAPVMMALDASKRDVCRVKRERTASPLQALAMLNGPQFVEASRALSQKLLIEHGSDSDRIVRHMFRLLTSRLPNTEEAAVIINLQKQQLKYFSANPIEARKYLSIGNFGDYKPVTKIILPNNKHNFRLGADANGGSPFRGEVGRATVISRALTVDEIKGLASLSRNAKHEFESVANNQDGKNQIVSTGKTKPKFAGGYLDFTATANSKLSGGFTLEAWIKPEQLSGRIWDKITPGQADGLLLDMHNGLRFICGNSVLMANRLPKLNEWSHVVCSVEFETGQVRFFLNGKPNGGTDLRTGNNSIDPVVLAAWSSVANTLINHDECVTKR